MDKNLKFCADLLTRKRQNVQPPLSANLDRAPWCPMIYDGVLCWPATEANQTATLPCPTRSERAKEFVFKTCGHRGQWAGRNPMESYGPHGYTDYSICGPGVYSSYSAVSIPSADEDISFSIYDNPSLWTTTISSASVSTSSLQSTTSWPYNSQAETVSSRSFLTKSLLSTANSLVSSKSQNMMLNSTTGVLKSIDDHNQHSMTVAAHYYLTMYNMKNVQWAGLVASLIAIFLLVTALIISRKITFRINHIRLNVLFSVVCCLLVTFLKDVFLVKYFSSEISTTRVNSILVALLVISELCKCCICIWIAVECTYQVFRILTRHYIVDELPFCYFAVPLYSLAISVTILWFFVVYLMEPWIERSYELYQDKHNLYWIMRTFHFLILLVAFGFLASGTMVMGYERLSVHIHSLRRFCDLLLTWFVWAFTTCFIFLPFLNESCTVPNASTAGSVTCLFFYFFGFFVSLLYAISQIVSPWSDYVIVYDRNNGRVSITQI